MQNTLEIIDTLNQRAFENIYIDISLTDKLTFEAEGLAAKKNYTKGIAWALLNRGLLNIEAGKFEQSSGNLHQAYHIFQDISDDPRGLTASENSLGLLSIRQGKMKSAFSYLQKAMNSSIANGFKDLQFTNMNYFGIHQYKTENFNQALRFFNKAIKLSTDKMKTGILNNLGCTYRELNDHEKALNFLNEALKQADLEGRKDTRIPIQEELGLTYGQMGQNEQGIKNLLDALEECTEYHNRYKLNINIHLGELYIKIENYDAAEKALNQAREYITDSSAILNRKLYLLLSELSEQKDDHTKALKFFKKYHDLSALLKSSEVDEKIWQMETEQLQVLNKRITTISEMGKKLTAQLVRGEVLETLLQSLNSLFQIDYCIIGELDVKTRTLHAKLYNRENNQISELEMDTKKPRNIISWVIMHKSGLILNDLKNEYSSYFSSLDNSAFPSSVSSTICLPFETAENAGVIGIYSRSINSFNNEDRDFLEMLTSYAAIALNNTLKTETIKSYNRELEILNKFDGLTGIYNRRHFLKILDKSWNISRLENSFFHFMLIDLDHFKDVNDTFGHEAGDLCLKSISRVFEKLFQRSVDGYGRYGGEEFVVYLRGMEHEKAIKLAEKLRALIEITPIIINGKKIFVTASIGLVCLQLNQNTTQSFQELIKIADKNMYQSKMDGRNRVTSSRL